MAAPRGEDEEVSVSAEELRAIEVDAAERAEENSGAAAEEGAGDDDGGDDDGDSDEEPKIERLLPGMEPSILITMQIMTITMATVSVIMMTSRNM